MRSYLGLIVAPFVFSLVACGGGTTPTDTGSGNDSGGDGGGMQQDVAGDQSPGMDATDTGSMNHDASGDQARVDTGTGTDTGTRTDTGTGTDTGPGTDAGMVICAQPGSTATPPATIPHVIVILEENKSFTSVEMSSSAPYFSSLVSQCGYSTKFVDNVFTTNNLPSEPHYLALTSGSNCDTGLTTGSASTSGSGCITDDSDPSAHTLSTTSIFNQVSSWRSYVESMSSNCDMNSSGTYAAKHNPAVFYTMLADCSSGDVPIAGITCPTTAGGVCSGGTPSNAFTQDVMNDTLPAYSFVVPNLDNDMHDGTISQGDNWLHTYLPIIFASPEYQRGDVVVMVLWDEGSSAGSASSQPNLFISPFIRPTASTDTMNLFSVLRTTENMLGISTYLGCASGTIPGMSGACPTGSTADLRTIFNM